MRRVFNNEPGPSETRVVGRFVEVALPTPVDRVFDYLVPDELAARAGIGHRVSVNFANRELQGFVVAQKDASPLLRHQIKEISKAPDDAPLVNESMLRLTRWMADYYACSWGEALQAVLPAVVRTGRPRKTLTVVKLARPKEEALAEAARLEAAIQNSRFKIQNSDSQGTLPLAGTVPATDDRKPTTDSRSARYAKILRTLATFNEEFTPLRLAEKLGYSLAPFNTLRKQGWLTFEKRPVDFGGVGSLGGEERVPQTLTGEQQMALDRITNSVDRDEFKTFLLFGITGSGKTEVYIRAMARALEHGKSAIVLVPEIALTPQTVRRFSHRFASVTFLHSSMTDAERREAWTRIKDGISRVVVGPRSALFAPVKDLGLIVVDEEHEHTYKQDSTPRYNARDTAIMRARLEHAAVILGSATPCLETWKNAQEGKYELLELRSRPTTKLEVRGQRSEVTADLEPRISNLGLPSVEIIDMQRECHEQHALAWFSKRLRGACAQALESGEQVIIFLNRRGYHTVLSCQACGEGLTCPNCTTHMSFHRQLNKAVCHYCLETRELPRRCPTCDGGPVKQLGIGTEKLEEEMKLMFGGFNIARMDSDAMKTREDYESTLEAFRQGETQVLVGTQMIAKGLDFPNVTVVGVVAADIGMNLGDFRSFERTFQIVTQVAGRAGRGEKPGTVIVQTFKPTHPAIVCAARQDYRGFVAGEMEHRRISHYPPFSRLVLVTVEAREKPKGEELARQIAATARDFGKMNQGSVFDVSDPFEAPMARLRGRHRTQVMIKAKGFREVRAVVDRIQPLVKVQEKLRVSIDVDPLDMM
ncbi:MAG: primosomal protein N' [Planctomycetes bacterium]|nr:primosomal protein N' [Planctomycetota bacterium]